MSIVAKLEVSSDGIATLVPFVSEKGIVMVVEFGYIPPEVSFLFGLYSDYLHCNTVFSSPTYVRV